MYEAFFHLKRRPFAATPDPQCFLASGPIRGALDELVVCVEQGQGISIVSAPAGTGKTLLCERLRLELQDRFACVMLRHASFLTRRALLQTILFELNQSYSRPDEQELRLELLPVLRSLRPQRESLVLLCDEAHLLSEDLLEELRIMSDLSEQGRPLVRLVLVGQPSLEETLAAPGLEALNQRIRAHVAMDPMDRMGTLDYIDYRITWAGGRTNELFQPEALDLICRASDGVPRCVNQLCDHALLLAFVAEESPVGPQLIREALRDLRQLPLHWNESLLNDQPRSTAGTTYRDPVYTEESSNSFTPNADHGSYEPATYETASFETAPAGTSTIEIGGDSSPLSESFPICAERSTSLLTTSIESATQLVALHQAESHHEDVELEHDDAFGDESFFEDSRGGDQTNESMTKVPSGLAGSGDSRMALDTVMTQLEQMRRDSGSGIERFTGGHESEPRSTGVGFSRRVGFVEETIVDRYAAIDGGFAVPEQVDPVEPDHPVVTTEERIEPTAAVLGIKSHDGNAAFYSPLLGSEDTGLTNEVHTQGAATESFDENSSLETGSLTEELQFPVAGAHNMDELVQQIADAIAKEVRESTLKSQDVAGVEADSTESLSSDAGFSDVCSRLGNMLPETPDGLCWDAESIRRALTSAVSNQETNTETVIESELEADWQPQATEPATHQTASLDVGIRDRVESDSSEEHIGNEVCELAAMTAQTVRAHITSTPEVDRLRAELGCDQRLDVAINPAMSDQLSDVPETDEQVASALWCRSTTILRESVFTSRESELQVVESPTPDPATGCPAGEVRVDQRGCTVTQSCVEEAHRVCDVSRDTSPVASIETPEPSSPPPPRSYRNLFSMLRRKQQNLL